MTDINRIALAAKCQPQTIKRAISNNKTTKASVRSALAKEGIHVELVKLGDRMRDWPACETANAFSVFKQNRVRK